MINLAISKVSHYFLWEMIFYSIMFSIELTHRQEDKHLTSMEGSYMMWNMNVILEEGLQGINQKVLGMFLISLISFPLFVKAKPEARSSQLSRAQRWPWCCVWWSSFLIFYHSRHLCWPTTESAKNKSHSCWCNPLSFTLVMKGKIWLKEDVFYNLIKLLLVHFRFLVGNFVHFIAISRILL